MKLSQLETPALYLDLDVFDRNQKRIVGPLEKYGLDLCPHYKSTKCTSIAHMQIAAGAKEFLCKTMKLGIWRLRMENILIANQVQTGKISR